MVSNVIFLKPAESVSDDSTAEKEYYNRERSYIFSNPMSNVSELDFMMKLWGEVLELLIGEEKDLY